MNPHLLKHIPPTSLVLTQEQIDYSYDQSKRSSNFILSVNTPNHVDQLNFVQSHYVPKSSIKSLLFSNYPESVQYAMVLYQKDDIKGAAKLLLFHKNISKQDGYITIKLINYSNKDIYYTGGFGGPNIDEIFVGQRIFKNYMDNKSNGFISAESWQRSFKIKNNTVLGGIIDFFPLEEKTEYGIVVYFTYSRNDKSPHAYEDINSEAFEYKEINENIDIKNIFKTHNIRFGASKLLANDSGILDGNYGVMHNYNLIFNKPGVYQLHFVANGGAAGFSCFLDGKYYQLFSKHQAEIVEIDINRPRIIQLETFPLPGSNYPVTITVKRKK